MTNPFFENHGPFKINEILKFISLKTNETNDSKIYDVKDLVSSTEKDLTFFHNKNYAALASKTTTAPSKTARDLSTSIVKST